MLGKEFGPIAVSTILGAFQDRPLVFVSSCELAYFLPGVGSGPF